MSLTTSQEHQLIVDAQAGDFTARMRLVTEYQPAFDGIISKENRHTRDKCDRCAELEGELKVEFLQTLSDIDATSHQRVWSEFGRTGVARAMESYRRLQHPTSGDEMYRMMKRVAQVERRVADLDETVEEACDYAEISVATFLDMQNAATPIPGEEVDEGRKDRYGRTVAPYAAGYRSDSVADAETALLAMTDLQRFLVTYKYGFPPADFDSMDREAQAVNAAERDALPAHGRSEAAVARWYTMQQDKPLTRSGGTSLSQQSVSNEIREALDTGAEAIRQYYSE